MRLDNVFNKIIRFQEEYEKTHDIDYYDGEFAHFHKLYEETLLKSPLKRRNAKYFIDNLDKVLKYTNLYNDDWIRYNAIHDNENFLHTLSHYLHCFRFPNHVDGLLNSLYSSLDETSCIKRSDIFSYRMLDTITDLNINDSFCYSNLFVRMEDNQKHTFLSLALEKKLDIDFLLFDLNSEDVKFIEQNVESFAENVTDLISLRKVIRNNPDSLKKINSYIDNHPRKIINSIVDRVFRQSEKKDRKELTEFLELLVKDICENEHVPISKLDYLSSGTFSSVYKIKDKILKISLSRGTERFPNNPYIIKPLLRKGVNLDGDKVFVEVTERVATGRIKEEDLYQLYKKLRDLNIIWTDVATRNAGYLLKDNVISWREELSPEDDVLELSEKRGDDSLKKGELVVLDSDFLFDENDPDIKYMNDNELQKRFEKRYRREKEARCGDELDKMLNESSLAQNSNEVVAKKANM